MRLDFEAYWLQKSGNARAEYEDAYAPIQATDDERGEFRCAVADGATETSFSGLWAQLLVDAYVDQRLAHVNAQTIASIAPLWHQEIAARTATKPLPWYALEKLERGAFSSLIGLSIRPDGQWRALCVGDSCLFHVRPRQAIRALPYHLPEQFTNHPLLISTGANPGIVVQKARGQWKTGDYFLLMTDALAHFFLSQRSLRAQLLAPTLDQAGFEQLIEAARGDRICRNDDVTFVKIAVLAAGQDGMA